MSDEAHETAVRQLLKDFDTGLNQNQAVALLNALDRANADRELVEECLHTVRLHLGHDPVAIVEAIEKLPLRDIDGRAEDRRRIANALDDARISLARREADVARAREIMLHDDGAEGDTMRRMNGFRERAEKAEALLDDIKKLFGPFGPQTADEILVFIKKQRAVDKEHIAHLSRKLKDGKAGT